MQKFNEELYHKNINKEIIIKNFSELNVNINLTMFKDRSYNGFRSGKNYYEPDLTKLLKQIIKKNFVIIDGGSNIGVHTITMSILGNKVYSFEPNIYSYKLLKKNIEKNNCNNVKTIHKGLSDIPQNIDIKFKSDVFFNNNCGSFTIGDAEEGENVVNVDLITIDSLNLEKLDLIRLDIEGYEARAIKGGLNTIKKYKPIIILESHVPSYVQSKYLEAIDIDWTKKLFDFLINIGYNINYINGYRGGGVPDFIFTPI